MSASIIYIIENVCGRANGTLMCNPSRSRWAPLPFVRLYISVIASRALCRRQLLAWIQQQQQTTRWSVIITCILHIWIIFEKKKNKKKMSWYRTAEPSSSRLYIIFFFALISWCATMTRQRRRYNCCWARCVLLLLFCCFFFFLEKEIYRFIPAAGEFTVARCLWNYYKFLYIGRIENFY